LTYFWDTEMWANTWAMLDPTNMKKFLEQWLTLDLHGDVYASDCMTGIGCEKWYAPNDWSVFRCLEAYIKITDDKTFLQKKIKGLTVLEHLDHIATSYLEFTDEKTHQCKWCVEDIKIEKKLNKQYKPSVLADYGKNAHILECAPAYEHRVPSLNAANVYMLRATADYYDAVGNKERASKLRSDAKTILTEVLQLYVPGEGVWSTQNLDGSKTQLRHCFDYITIGQSLEKDLSPQMKSEMNKFVENELLTKTWMRAMSLKDSAASHSDRPDHGPMGSYDAWPPMTMDVMCRFGAFDKAVAFLRATEVITHQGSWAQSHEFLGPESRGFNPIVRTASRGGQDANEGCGTAFAEVIIRSFFGFRPDLSVEKPVLLSPNIPRGFNGELKHISWKGKLFTILSNAKGLRIIEEK